MPNIAVDLETKEQGRIWHLPPYNYSIRRISSELRVAVGTVHKWREKLKDEGLLEEQEKPNNDEFTAEQIFAIVIQTATMSEAELASYCRENGLYVEQVKAWRISSIQVHQPQKESKHKQDAERRADRKKIRELEKELARKEKALAETAALLVLREKLDALWENSEDD